MTGLGWPAQAAPSGRASVAELGWPAVADRDGADEARDAAPAGTPAAEDPPPAVAEPVAELAVAEPAVSAPTAEREPEPPPAATPSPPRVRPTTAEDTEEAARRIRGLLRDDLSPAPGREPVDPGTPIGREAAAALRVREPARDPFPRPAQRRVITIANQKGGVGKTTSTVNLAVALALHGAQVLVVDLDPQGNASTGLGVEHHSAVPDVYDVLINGLAVADVVQPAAEVPGCWCVPATIDLAGAEIELVSVVARESRLQKALATYCEGPGADLDYVLVDCPPSLGLLTVNAMVATSEVLIPIQCEYYALEGLGQLLRTVEMVKAHLNPALAVSTILLTMYDSRTRLADQVADEVRSHFGEVVLGASIPRSVRVSEAPGYGRSVVTYDPGSRGAVAYVDAARELAHRGAAATTSQEPV